MPILNRSYIKESLVGPAGLGHGECGHKVPSGMQGLDKVYGVLMKANIRHHPLGDVNQFSIKWDVPAVGAKSTFWIYMGIMLENCDTFGSLTVWKGSPLLGDTWAMAGGFFDEVTMLDVTPAMIVPTGRTIVGNAYRNDANHWLLDTYDTLRKKPLRLIKRLREEAHWVYVALEMTDGGDLCDQYPRSEGIKFYDIMINGEPANLKWDSQYQKSCITDIKTEPDSVFLKWSP